MNTPNEKSGIGPVIMFIAIALVIVFAGGALIKTFKNFIEGLGLTDSREGRENAEYIDATVNNSTALGTGSAWSPNYHKNKKVSLTRAAADKVATLFWDSVGYVYDSPAKGVAAVKMIPDKNTLSWVAYCFREKYGLDLLAWLNDKYDRWGQREYLRQILEYANTLK